MFSKGARNIRYERVSAKLEFEEQFCLFDSVRKKNSKLWVMKFSPSFRTDLKRWNERSKFEFV